MFDCTREGPTVAVLQQLIASLHIIIKKRKSSKSEEREGGERERRERRGRVCTFSAVNSSFFTLCHSTGDRGSNSFLLAYMLMNDLRLTWDNQNLSASKVSIVGREERRGKMEEMAEEERKGKKREKSILAKRWVMLFSSKPISGYASRSAFAADHSYFLIIFSPSYEIKY